MSAPVVVITGCSEGGIGYALCQEFAARGCRVYATARDVNKMKSLTTSSKISALTMDVTNDTSIASTIEKIVSETSGRIDLLVNNAGMACYGPVLEVPLEEVTKVFETNVLSVLRVTRAVIPHMSSRKAGTIVNIGSIVGEIHTPWSGIYSSSKAAMMAISNILEMECRPFNVKVMLVAPGGVHSGIAKNGSARYTGLSQNSPWHDYAENINRRMWTSQASGSMDTKEFSKAVVDKALATTPPVYMTLGSLSTVMWVLKWLPLRFINGYLWKRFGTLVNTKKLE